MGAVNIEIELETQIAIGKIFSYGLTEANYEQAELPMPKMLLYYKFDYDFKPLIQIHFWLLDFEKNVFIKHIFNLANCQDHYTIFGVDKVVAINFSGDVENISENLNLDQVSFWSNDLSSWILHRMIEDIEKRKAKEIPSN